VLAMAAYFSSEEYFPAASTQHNKRREMLEYV
jgi:hypothetical protein